MEPRTITYSGFLDIVLTHAERRDRIEEYWSCEPPLQTKGTDSCRIVRHLKFVRWKARTPTMEMRTILTVLVDAESLDIKAPNRFGFSYCRSDGEQKYECSFRVLHQGIEISPEFLFIYLPEYFNTIQLEVAQQLCWKSRTFRVEDLEI